MGHGQQQNQKQGMMMQKGGMIQSNTDYTISDYPWLKICVIRVQTAT